MAETPPRTSNALLREIVVGRLDDMVRRLDKAEETAGEARDTARELVTILREQDTSARLGEIKGEFRESMAALRQDVVAANTRLRQDLEAEAAARISRADELEERLAALEAERNKVVGVADFFAWLSRVAPWLLAGIAAFVAGIGFKGGGQ